MSAAQIVTAPCGCDSVSRCCPEDTRLWSAVNSAYELGRVTGDYCAYDAARATYMAHREPLGQLVRSANGPRTGTASE